MTQQPNATTTSFIISANNENHYQAERLQNFVNGSSEITMATQLPQSQNQQFTITCTGIITNCNQPTLNPAEYHQQYMVNELLPKPPPYPSNNTKYQAKSSCLDSVDSCHLQQQMQACMTNQNLPPKSEEISINEDRVPIEQSSTNEIYFINQGTRLSDKIDKSSDLQSIYSSYIYNQNGFQTATNNTQHQNFKSVESAQSNETNNSSHRSSMSSLECSASNSSIPVVNGKFLKGYNNEDILKNWLKSIKSEQYLKNFIDNGYDLHLVSRMTPQDLAAIGCRCPEVRKKLLNEIKKLKLKDNIPDYRPPTLKQWLEKLKLIQYYDRLYDEGINTIDLVCQLSWEDFEDFGICMLGHQKKLLLAIEAIKKFDKIQEDQSNQTVTYEVHQNHRMSMHESRMGTLGRATLRSGFSQIRAVSQSDQRLPMASLMPTSSPVRNDQESSHNSKTNNTRESMNQQIYDTSRREQIYGSSSGHRSLATLKRPNPPMPPTRTNSLKFPETTEKIQPDLINNNNSIYGNNSGILPTTVNTVSNGATSFLRTPKLGTLTATTNKMLQNGGHIESISNQTIIQSSIPVREAPLPPLPLTNPPIINGRPVDRSNITCSSRDKILSASNTLDDEEFPPPPPMSTLDQ